MASDFKVIPLQNISNSRSSGETSSNEIRELQIVLKELESESNIIFEEKFNRIEKLADDSDMVGAVAFSPDGNYLAVSTSSRSVKLYLIEERLLYESINLQDRVHRIIFSSDSKLLVFVIDYATLGSFNIGTKQLELVPCTDMGDAFDISLDFEYIAHSSYREPNEIIFKEFKKTIELFRLTGHKESVEFICFGPDRKILASCSEDKMIILWSIASKQELFVFPPQYNQISALSISPDGKYLASGTFQLFKLWDLHDKIEIGTFAGHTYHVKSLAFSTNCKFLVSGSEEQKIKIWNLDEKREEFTIEAKDILTNVCCNHDASIIACVNSDSKLRIINLKEKSAEKVLESHLEAIKSVVFNKNGTLLATGSHDMCLAIWNVANQSLYHKFKGHKEIVFCMEFTLDDRIVSADSIGLIIIWDLKKKIKVSEIFQGFCVTSLCFSLDYKLLVTGIMDGLITVWNLEDPTQENYVFNNKSMILSLKFSPDGKYLACGGSDCLITVWNFSKREIEYSLAGHTLDISSVCYSPDNKRLASGSFDKSVRIWNLQDGSEEYVFYGHSLDVQGIAYSPDGKFVASASEDKTIKIWNLNERREEYCLKGHTSCVESVAFSPDQKYLVSVSQDKTLRFWKFDEYDKAGLKLNEVYMLRNDRYQNFLQFYNALYNIGLKKNDRISIETTRIRISKYLFTTMHILAYLGEVSIIEGFTKKGEFELTSDAFGHSPLFYSIKAQHQKVTDLLLDYIVSLSEKKISQSFVRSLFALRKDIIYIIRNSSTSLDKFLSCCVFSKLQNAVFGVPLSSLPVIKLNHLEYPPFSLFIKENSSSTTIPLMFKSCYFKIPEIIGSKTSIEFLDCILRCTNKDIYRTQIIKFFAKSRWDILKPIIYAFTLVLWVNLIFLIIAIDKFSVKFYMPLIILNLFLFAWELAQFSRIGKLYLIDPWNYIDASRVITTFLWIALNAYDRDYILLTWFVCLLNIIRGITGFRAFDTTRYYIKLISLSLFNIRSFLLIFIYTTLCFGLLTIASNASQETTFQTLWMNSFDLLVGQPQSIEPSSFNVQYVTFIIAVVINVILMLNLIISILGDSFNQFQQMAEVYNYSEMIEVILEIEQIISLFNRPDSFQHLHACVHAYGEDSQPWTGRVLSTAHYMKNIEERLTEKFNEKIKATEIILMENLQLNHNITKNDIRNCERKLNGQIENVEKKLDLLINLLKK